MNVWNNIGAKIETWAAKAYGLIFRAKMERRAKELESRLKSKLEEVNAVATGKLKNTLSIEVEQDGFKWRVILHALDYWDYLSEGRPPGKFPPPDAIRKWIIAKPITPYPDRRGRIPTLQQLTYLICRGIWKNGIEPRNLNVYLDRQAKELKFEIEKTLNDE